MSWGVRDMHVRHPMGTFSGSARLLNRKKYTGTFAELIRSGILQ